MESSCQNISKYNEGIKEKWTYLRTYAHIAPNLYTTLAFVRIKKSSLLGQDSKKDRAKKIHQFTGHFDRVHWSLSHNGLPHLHSVLAHSFGWARFATPVVDTCIACRLSDDIDILLFVRVYIHMYVCTTCVEECSEVVTHIWWLQKSLSSLVYSHYARATNRYSRLRDPNDWLRLYKSRIRNNRQWNGVLWRWAVFITYSHIW